MARRLMFVQLSRATTPTAGRPGSAGSTSTRPGRPVASMAGSCGGSRPLTPNSTMSPRTSGSGSPAPSVTARTSATGGGSAGRQGYWQGLRGVSGRGTAAWSGSRVIAGRPNGRYRWLSFSQDAGSSRSPFRLVGRLEASGCGRSTAIGVAETRPARRTSGALATKYASRPALGWTRPPVRSSRLGGADERLPRDILAGRQLKEVASDREAEPAGTAAWFRTRYGASAPATWNRKLASATTPGTEKG